MRQLLAPLAIALALTSRPGLAQDGQATGCSFQVLDKGWKMDGGSRVYDETKFTGMATKPRIPVYREARGEASAGRPLKFSERVRVIDAGTVGAPRLRIKSTLDDHTGWVSRGDVLCREDPLADSESGLPRRMVVRTDTAERGQLQAKTAYHSPTRECQDGPQSCLQVSKFKWYFVYLEQDGYFLLGDRPNLRHPASRFIGWLPGRDGLAWNTSVGLRPVEEPQERRTRRGEKGKFLCLFAKPEDESYRPLRRDLDDPEKCVPLLGGKRWYEIDVRLPLIRELRDDQQNLVYEVAASSAATTGNLDGVLNRLAELKGLDVFFVIDGTKSMQPAIDAIRGTDGQKGLVERLRDKLKGKLAQGGKLRLGYRVYRDSIRGVGDGIANSEAMPLPASCESNIDDFVRSFRSVKAYDPPGDTDFAENSFAGLAKAGEDILSCPGHVKVVFLIGDHGYDAKAQEQRGFPSITLDQVVNRFRRAPANDPKGIQPLVTIIQTASFVSSVSAAKQEEYNTAYREYEAQGKAFLEKLYAGTKVSIAPREFFHQLTAATIADVMIDKIMGPVDTLLNPEGLTIIAESLAAGQSLEQAIQRVTSQSGSTVMPAIFFDIVAADICQRLGDQCRRRVLEGVFPAYLQASADIDTDVLLSTVQYKAWLELLQGIKETIETSSRVDSQEVRNQLVTALLEGIATRLKIVLDEREGYGIGRMIALRGGLPYGAQSPLMSYAPDELRNTRTVPGCEIEHLLSYADAKLLILKAARDGEYEINFTARQLPQGFCGNASPKGRLIPLIEGRPSPRPLNRRGENTNYKYKRNPPDSDEFYWMPNRYLP